MRRLAALACVTALACGFTGAGAAASGAHLVHRSAYLMGTRADLSVWAPVRADGLARLERALEALEETERQLSTWLADSRLSSLNRAPLHTPWQADPALCALLSTLDDWYDDSNGAFDPAIGALVAAWDLRGAGSVPSRAAIARARAASGLRHVSLDRARCTVVRHGPATIDAGAFGKGEALDRAARHLGGVPWMIDLGGQVSVAGGPPGRAAWVVSVAHPRDRSRAFLDVRMQTGSLATSGGSERDLMIDGRRVGHVLDPRTGAPAAFQGSVTVWHESGLVADILSTALYVMGPEEGVSWAEARGLAACYLEADSDGRITPSMTPAFRSALHQDHAGRTPTSSTPGR